ncbi:hypothetical protein H671_1g2578 [Cricetulus griseus]|uniref:Uncharacterized protein n=1 Tax=Cricetulus griseus TaxID=10029 RepID=A0A061IPZ1_CRIGR|nr:hypothetical protein H671_1g2578 [Cricetulus griseus]
MYFAHIHPPPTSPRSTLTSLLTHVPLREKHSKSLILCTLPVWVFVLIAIYCQDTSLMKTERCSNLMLFDPMPQAPP